jgi:hypothetical protein
LSCELETFDCILVEGVRLPGRRRAPLYDIAARSLGLAAQSKRLKYPESVEIRNVDIKSHRFRRLFGALPVLQRMQLWFLRYLIGIVCLLVASTPKGKRIIFERTNRTRTYRPNSLLKLIGPKRDFYIVRNIEASLSESLQAGTAKKSYAIVFGAAHMPAIGMRLRKLGFRVKERKWMDVVVPTDWMR